MLLFILSYKILFWNTYQENWDEIPFPKIYYTTEFDLFSFNFDRSKTQFQYTFCSGPKSFKISVILDLRKVKIVEKLSNLVYFDYFCSKSWFFSMMSLNFRKEHQKMKSLKFFKVTVPHFEGNSLPKKEENNLHKSNSWTKNFFLRSAYYNKLQ